MRKSFGFVGRLGIVSAGLLVLTFAHRVQAMPDVSPFSGCNEPSTAVVNPLNPQNIAVAECNTLAISTDFGRTFPITHVVTDAIPPGLTGYGSDGDGVVSFDSQGRLYWSFLIANSGDVRVVVVRVNATTGALQPSADLSGTGGSAPYNDDKEWIAADANPQSPFHDNVYVVWSNINTNEVEFSRSTDGGVTWSARRVVSNAATEGFDWPSHVAVGPNGDVYVSYHTQTCNSDPTVGQIEVLRDSQAGANLAAGNPVQKTSFASSVTCNVQSGSDKIPLTHFWMQGAQAPYVIPDPVRPGNIYVITNDDPDDNYTSGDPGDAIIARSTDNGQTWTTSQVGHPPANTLQVYPTGAIDPTGLLFVHWWDTRANNINPGVDGILGTADDYYNLDLYGSVSNDGGLTWTNDFRINDASFDPDAGAPCRFDCGPPVTLSSTLRIGEYNGIAAADGNGYVAWTGNGPSLLFDVVSLQGLFPDRFEPNDSMQPGVPTDLGAAATYSEPDLSIHDAQDNDFFKLTALNTGSLTVQISQNPRLADLDIQILDKYANVLGTSTLGLDSNPTEQLTIPVVAGEPYFVRVYPEPNQFPPQNMYDFSAVNTQAPVPFGLALAPGSDSGRDAHDNVTNVSMPTITLYADTVALAGLVLSLQNGTPTITDDNPGYKIGVFVNGSSAPTGFAAPAGGLNPDQFTFTFASALPDGLDSISARVIIVDPSDDPSIPGTAHVVGMGGPSQPLQVTIDTQPPATPGAPDLTAPSDTGGVSDDNITTVQSPQFAGTGEANALAHLYAGSVEVGNAFVGTGGSYQVTSAPLADGVYLMTVALEDLAGNRSAPSAPLKVTIAHTSLILPGATASGPAAGPLTVDLGAGTISGFSGIAGASGSIGIVGIPSVTLDANSYGVTILGTAGDDAITFTPTGPHAGTVVLAATGQSFTLSGVGAFTIDPLAGNDVVSVMGTANADTVTANVDTNSTVQVNSFLVLSVPTANVERLAISTLAGQDSITVNAKDTVNANLSVDAGDPAPAQNKIGDVLAGYAVSPKGQVQNSPGGPTQGSGVLTISYPKTTGTTVTIDYTAVEKVVK